MFVLHSYAWAVIFCIITMFCWGSWANTQKLASGFGAGFARKHSLGVDWRRDF